MADDKKEPKKSGEFRVPPRTWILWIAILGAIPLLLLFRTRPNADKDLLTEAQFIDLLHQTNVIESGTIWWDIQSPLLQDVTGTYMKNDATGKPVRTKYRATIHVDEALSKELRDSGVFESQRPNTLVQNM